MPIPTLERAKIGVIGPGHPGLPRAAEAARQFETPGLDIEALGSQIAIPAWIAPQDVHAPWVDADEAFRAHGIRLTPKPEPACCGAVIPVGHRQFAAMGEAGLRSFGKPGAVRGEVHPALASGRRTDMSGSET